MIDGNDVGAYPPNAGRGFTAFRDRVAADYALLAALRPPLGRDAYVAAVVNAGAACGFVFDADAVWAALHEGETRSLASDDPP